MPSLAKDLRRFLALGSVAKSSRRATQLAMFDLNFFLKEAEMVVPQREETLCPILLSRSV